MKVINHYNYNKACKNILKSVLQLHYFYLIFSKLTVQMFLMLQNNYELLYSSRNYEKKYTGFHKTAKNSALPSHE